MASDPDFQGHIITEPSPGSGSRVRLGDEPPVRLGPLLIEPARRRLAHDDGREEILEPRAMQVLVALLRARGEVVSRDALFESCWSGTIVGDDAINRAVSRVRHAAAGIGTGIFHVETVARVGHRLAIEVETGPSPAATPSGASRWSRSRLSLAALMMILAVAAAVLVGTRFWPTPAEPVRSVAVLPFRSLSPGNELFAEGVAEEIMTILGRDPQLRVAGRLSTSLFKDSANPRDVGRRLDVAYLLEGSVRQEGRRVRIDVALVDTRDGMRLWSQAFQGSLDDIFALQTEIGRAVAGRMNIQLANAEAPTGPRVTRADVYSLYLTARSLMRERTPAKLETAVTLLRRAVELDPNYAPAWSSLGVAVKLAWWYGDGRYDTAAPLEEATRYVNRALALAPDLAEAHAALATVRDYDLSTLPHLERATRLDPGNAENWYWLYNARTLALDFEGALEAIRRSAAIDPYWIHNSWAPTAAWDLGNRDEARRYWRRTAENHPDPFQRDSALWGAASASGDLSLAYRHARAAALIASPDMQEPAGHRVGSILLRLGFLEEARIVSPMPDFIFEMMSGRAPTADMLQTHFGHGADFWSFDESRIMLPRLLLDSGRGDELIALYDRAFTSPGQMAARHPNGRAAFVRDAPAIAVALRGAGRTAEADRLLALADRLIRAARERGRVPASFEANSARVWATQGRTVEALAALQRAIASGWRHRETAILPRLADDPGFRNLRGDPRFRRLDAMLQAEVARERRELRSAGL